MSGRRTRVLIADDHPIVREGLRTVLGTLPDFELAGEAATGTEAVEAATAEAPDIVVMDLQMPELDGIEAIRRIVAARPGTAVLVLTMFEDHAMLEAAMRAGARGYLLKGAGHQDIARALRSVAGGEAVFGAGVADHVLSRLTGRDRPETLFPQLTAREREVLTLLADGRGTQDIARRLYLSPKTVRNHIASVLAKLEVPDRSQAIVAARQAGLGRSP